MSETVISPAPATNGQILAVDAAGRRLVIEKMDVLRELDLIEAAGQLAENRRWMLMATLACCVTSIDDVPLPRPQKKEDIRRQVGRVGSDGIAAVVKALNVDGVEEDAPDPNDTVATAKN